MKERRSVESLAEALSKITSFTSPDAAAASAADVALEATDAELGAVQIGGEVLAAAGTSPETARALTGDLAEGNGSVSLGGDDHFVLRAHIDGPEATIAVARRERPFRDDDGELLKGLASILGVTLRMLHAVEEEREHRVRSEEQVALNEHLIASLQDQRALLEKLSRIQRSISHRAPLQEVLDAITEGAREMLGDDVAGIRLIDPEDRTRVMIVSSSGVPEKKLATIRRGPVTEGAGGRAILEERLVILNNYYQDPDALKVFRADKLQTAIAAPIYEDGAIAGSLSVGSFVPERTYSDGEQEAMLALAEHASLALTDAKTVEAMREAQRAKDMFFAMASHELKTPLAVILVALHTLDKHHGSVPEDMARRMLGAARERVQDLSKLIDRLLQGARAELAIKKEPVRLAELIEKAIDGLSDAHPIDVTVRDEQLRTDPAAVRQALGILIENALAHAADGSPIRLDAAVVDGEVGVKVRNRGTLPEGLDKETLFNPFQRGPATASAGVGLGLYIAARLAGALGGRIEVGSADGWVSFTLLFPRDEALPA